MPVTDHADRVEKLLARAQREDTPESEAEWCLQKAAEIMHTYNIDAKLLSLKAQVKLAPDVRQFYIVPPFVTQKITLLAVIARSFGCQVITGRGKSAAKNDGVAECDVFGFENEIEATQTLYISAVVVGELGSARRRKQGNTSKKYQTSYWGGFASGINEQLKAATQQAETEAENKQAGTALVLRDMRSEVDKLMREKYPHVKFVRRPVTDYAGYSDGKSDGLNADLYSRNQVSTTRRALE